MTAVENMGTEDLMDHAYATLRKLKNLVKVRRRREKAMELVTDLFLAINTLSPRVAGMTFTEGPVAVEDDEDHPHEPGVPMADLFSGDDEDHVDADDVVDVDELRRIIRGLQHSRLHYFRLFLAYFTRGCRQEMDVSKRVLAAVRRVSPQLLTQFGLSAADVGRKLNQKRATVSVREKVLVERPMKAAGARGIISNGARGKATSEACARAAKRTKNRRAKGKRGTTD